MPLDGRSLAIRSYLIKSLIDASRDSLHMTDSDWVNLAMTAVESLSLPAIINCRDLSRIDTHGKAMAQEAPTADHQVV